MSRKRVMKRVTKKNSINRKRMIQNLFYLMMMMMIMMMIRVMGLRRRRRRNK